MNYYHGPECLGGPCGCGIGELRHKIAELESKLDRVLAEAEKLKREKSDLEKATSELGWMLEDAREKEWMYDGLNR